MKSTVFVTLGITAILQGCATYGTPQNKPTLQDSDLSQSYSYQNSVKRYNSGEVMVLVAFSGGGTRAAAFAYGVMEGMRDQPLESQSYDVSFLDEVDNISSVSGGSFTAAYYGLYGDKLFTDFEQEFLYNDVTTSLLQRFLTPTLWFSSSGITDEAITYYQEELFKGATFADINQTDKPLVVINATDLGTGVRFSYVQEYFDLLCSDISQYPVANAVAASAAVPVFFNPVVLENYGDCGDSNITNLVEQSELNSVAKSTHSSLSHYLDKEQTKYIHLVDGGITDNLGLFSLYDMMAMHGGQEGFFTDMGADLKPYVVVISVDASAKPQNTMGQSVEKPDVTDTISFMTDIQLHRYNDLTKNLIRETLKRNGQAATERGQSVSTYFVDINLNDVTDEERRVSLNNIPTALNLEKEQVDLLVQEGREQLLKNEDFRRFLEDFRKKN
ncbi:patatin-like phospholipase family protein [Vibrio maerlii]|uniref:patatin-like phospholipase family protein n=1 Tax=Vibrio maerlii TaxID=2231648 RepID=UPI000E3C73C6|nr:patatin-like phospholipase family protein [Vibrio maerlii]